MIRYYSINHKEKTADKKENPESLLQKVKKTAIIDQNAAVGLSSQKNTFVI